jgi:hypothetical protein
MSKPETLVALQLRVTSKNVKQPLIERVVEVANREPIVDWSW